MKYKAPPGTENRVAPTSGRNFYLRDKQGDVVGGNFWHPQGKFSHMLGFDTYSEHEENHPETISGGRLIDYVIAKSMQRVGRRLMPVVMTYRSMWYSDQPLWNEPGSVTDTILENADFQQRFASRRQARLDEKDIKMLASGNMQYMDRFIAAQRTDNSMYLTQQYRSGWSVISETLVSNVTQRRHEGIVKAIRSI